MGENINFNFILSNDEVSIIILDCFKPQYIILCDIIKQDYNKLMNVNRIFLSYETEKGKIKKRY